MNRTVSVVRGNETTGSDKDEDEHGCGDTLYEHGCGDSLGNPVEIDNDIHNKRVRKDSRRDQDEGKPVVLLVCPLTRYCELVDRIVTGIRRKSFCGEPGSRQILPVGGILKPSGEALKTR